jgi:hypothetical protein
MTQPDGMTRPETLFEAASYDLNKFRERRVADRRMTPRGTIDRRMSQNGNGAGAEPPQKSIDPGTESDRLG